MRPAQYIRGYAAALSAVERLVRGNPSIGRDELLLGLSMISLRADLLVQDVENAPGYDMDGPNTCDICD